LSGRKTKTFYQGFDTNSIRFETSKMVERWCIDANDCEVH